jgi:hypothetical protein
MKLFLDILLEPIHAERIWHLICLDRSQPTINRESLSANWTVTG